jgi:hypothetical protein
MLGRGYRLQVTSACLRHLGANKRNAGAVWPGADIEPEGVRQ